MAHSNKSGKTEKLARAFFGSLPEAKESSREDRTPDPGEDDFAAPDSEHARAAMEAAKQLVPAATIAGSCNCQGEVEPTKLERIRAQTPPPVWVADADASAGHPDQGERSHWRRDFLVFP